MMHPPRAAAVLLVILAGASACKKGDTGAPQGGGRGGKGGGKGSTFAVDVIAVESKQVDYVVTAPGTLDAFERVLVTARVSGIVDKVSFAEGQQVTKGDVLVVIESERYQLAASSAKAMLDRADAVLADAEAQVARREAATKSSPGLITGEELATYRTKVLTAKADRAVAAENLKVAGVNLRDAYVRAPMTGIMQTRTVETGQYVQVGYLMATLLHNDPMLVRFPVEPGEAPRLKAGMTATFKLRETQRTYKANITLVGASADALTHTVPVVASVVDEGHKYWLRPGSFCDVTIEIGGTREAPIVPRTAARATDRGYLVYVVEGDVAKERIVTLGMSTKTGWVEVRSGLKAGETLVVRGAEALSPGASVKATKVEMRWDAPSSTDKGDKAKGADDDAKGDKGDKGDKGKGTDGPKGAGEGAPSASGSGHRRKP